MVFVPPRKPEEALPTDRFFRWVLVPLVTLLAFVARSSFDKEPKDIGIHPLDVD